MSALVAAKYTCRGENYSIVLAAQQLHRLMIANKTQLFFSLEVRKSLTFWKIHLFVYIQELKRNSHSF